MDQKVIDAYIKAGKIAKQARELGISLCKEGASALEISEKVEAKIRALGGELAFPTDVSINEITAHYSPITDDKTTLKKGDLVKIDVGVQINGYVADTAESISIGKDQENEELIEASISAINSGIKALKSGISIGELGEAIFSGIKNNKIQIIQNLRGHGLEQYNLHAGISIVNYGTADKTKLKDVAIAIEPFTTFGAGLVVDAQPAQIYNITERKATRTGKEILDYVWNKYQYLPFSQRELVKKFGLLKAKLAIKEMLSRDILHEYNVLREKTKHKVAQTEHTVLVLEDKVIVTTK